MNLPMTDYLDTFSKTLKAYTRFFEPLYQKFDLTKTEVDILIFLRRHPEMNRAADIVDDRCIAKSHVSASIATLEAHGLLRRLSCQQAFVP